MTKLLYFDYAAIMILATLVVATLFRRMTKGRLNRTYIYILLVGLVSVIADIFAVWLDNMGPGNVEFKYSWHTVYLMVHNMATPTMVLYLMILSHTDHKMTGKNRVIFSAPYITVVVMLMANFFNHKMFYMDENGMYTRGPLFFILYLSAVYYIVYGFYQLIRYRKTYVKDSFIALFMVFPIMIIAVVIQYFFPRFLFEMFANAIGILLIGTIVQRPEVYLDVDTGFGKKNSFVTDMKNYEINGKKADVILANITNYSTLHNMIGYGGMQQVLKIISDRVKVLLQEGYGVTEIYYLGGGQFRFVMIYRRTDLTAQTAEYLNNLMKQPVNLNDMELHLVVPVVVCHYLTDVNSADALLNFGDQITRKQYTGHVLQASDLYNEKQYAIMSNINDIVERGFANNNFSVYYQPIYSLEEKRFNSAEALLRLNDDMYGFISPEIFIPAAEKSGEIHRIGKFVMEEVCSFIASEEFKNLGVDYIEVNLSVAQCMRLNLADEVLSIMKKYDVKPSQINLEITETATSYSQEAMMSNINRLSQAGIAFSLDDYGTGYSNMSRIATMPFHIIKLDKTLTTMERNQKMLIILENTIKMIKDMDMKIVVEGVETERLVKQFSDFKCEYIQGYYYSKPIPKNDFVEFIQDNLDPVESV